MHLTFLDMGWDMVQDMLFFNMLEMKLHALCNYVLVSLVILCWYIGQWYADSLNAFDSKMNQPMLLMVGTASHHGPHLTHADMCILYTVLIVHMHMHMCLFAHIGVI